MAARWLGPSKKFVQISENQLITIRYKCLVGLSYEEKKRKYFTLESLCHK